MKTLLLFALAIGIVLNSPCTEVKPNKSDDCLSIYSPDSICCMHKLAIDKEETVSCVDKDISYSGKSEYEEVLIKGKRTKASLTCLIKIDFCGPITADEANECLDAEIPNGLCCFDHKQGVCFSSPFHFKSVDITCQKTEKKPEIKPEIKPKLWPWV